MDFELELACIIGKKGKDISHANAEDHIFGYTIYNDFSARDTQMQESAGPLGPAKSKDFDDSIVLGPVIVTADELEDPYHLRMQARINGETWCDNNSSTIHWKFSDMIAHISKSETLHPGEVIGSGTVGLGCGLEHLRFLNDGDVVELEIEHIGVISNKVVRR
jgi:2-keto-4-pentenoate hydratase/2-oxohepta-3-ene-1,7-dioic acid hydratase in catechol pathway